MLSSRTSLSADWQSRLGLGLGSVACSSTILERKLTAPVFSRCQPTWSCLSTFTLVLERTTPGQMRRWWMFSITLKQAQSCSFRKPGITIWALSKQFHLQLYRKLQAQKWRGNRAKLQGKPAKLRIPKNACNFQKNSWSVLTNTGAKLHKNDPTCCMTHACIRLERWCPCSRRYACMVHIPWFDMACLFHVHDALSMLGPGSTRILCFIDVLGRSFGWHRIVLRPFNRGCRSCQMWLQALCPASLKIPNWNRGLRTAWTDAHVHVMTWHDCMI